jgi:hypothetical protein
MLVQVSSFVGTNYELIFRFVGARMVAAVKHPGWGLSYLSPKVSVPKSLKLQLTRCRLRHRNQFANGSDPGHLACDQHVGLAGEGATGMKSFNGSYGKFFSSAALYA